MASEITSEPMLEESIGMNLVSQGDTLEIDTLESFMPRPPMRIFCDLPKGAIETFQHIIMGKIYPRVIFMDRSALHASLHKKEIPPPKVVEEFEECLRFHEINRLLEMVNEFPTQLFLHIVSTSFSRAALHVTILESSQTLVDAMMKKLEKEGQSTSKYLEQVVQDFMLKVDGYGLSAINMATLIGNEDILSHFEKFLEFQISDLEILFYGHSLPLQCSEKEKKKILEQASPLLNKQAPLSIHQGTIQLSIQEWLLKKSIDFVYCLHEDSRDQNYSQQQQTRKFVKYVFDSKNSCFLEPLRNV